MTYQPEIGDILRMHSWHGVVMEVFTNQTGKMVLKVQTARNVFRGYPPEFIEVEAAPEAITRATQADLEQEIAYLQRLRDIGLEQMLACIKQDETIPAETPS